MKANKRIRDLDRRSNDYGLCVGATTMPPRTMTRFAMRKVLKRHRGEQAALARSLSIKEGTLSKWLGGDGTSRPIHDAVERRVRELLEEEANGTR